MQNRSPRSTPSNRRLVHRQSNPRRSNRVSRLPGQCDWQYSRLTRRNPITSRGARPKLFSYPCGPVRGQTMTGRPVRKRVSRGEEMKFSGGKLKRGIKCTRRARGWKDRGSRRGRPRATDAPTATPRGDFTLRAGAPARVPTEGRRDIPRAPAVLYICGAGARQVRDG